MDLVKFFLLSFLCCWLIRETKAILFWLYLWQLKEYRLDRFLDHFRTAKGKELLLNEIILLLLKLPFVFIFVIWFLFADDLTIEFFISFFGLFVIYVLEALKALKDFFQKKIKTPVFTKKIIFLLSLLSLTGFIPAIIFFYFIPIGIVIFDLLTPLIVSVIVLLFQPLAVLAKNQIIKKAKKKREQFKNLLVIGITGSYGKTSTKEFLAAILSEKFNVLKTKENQNTEIGISRCILNDLKGEHEILVCEMGAYKRGEIKFLCDITKPKIGIITGINEQHLATFGTMENLISAEGGEELIESLPRSQPKVVLRGLPINGIAFFNGKNRYCREQYQKTKIKKFLYGENVQLAGLENIEGAKAVAKELGMTEEEISRAVEKIKNKFPGIKLKKGINNLNIIDTTYSANPDGVMAHLEYLKTFPGKKVIIMPCLIELGKASKEVHKRIGRKISEVCDLAIITTKDRFKEIKESAGEKALFLENPKEIFEKIKNFSQSGDIILLESRVPSQLISLLVD